MLISTYYVKTDQGGKIMSYVQGFVLPVPADKKEAYRQAAADFSSIAKEFGATRQVEA